jgi:hypothetical protein
MDSTQLVVVEQIGKQLTLLIGLVVALIGAGTGLWHQVAKLKQEVKREKST